MSNRFIKRVRNIPTLPNVLAQIIQTLDAPNSSASDLESIVRNDQAITTKLLAVANSAYYGFHHQITTVRQAVVAIGFTEVRNVCLGLSLMGFLHPSTFPDRHMAEQLWLHSLATSEAARILAKHTGSCDPGQAFTSGLLHDIGKVIMAAFAAEQVASLFEFVQERQCGYLEAEKELGFSHEEIGKELSLRWDLPPVLGQVIGRHHSLEPNMEHLPLVSIVSAADYLVRSIGIGESGNTDPPELAALALESMNSDLNEMEECRQEVEAREPTIEQHWQEMMNRPRSS
jgi:putative nucleotidyltransferase with HDIG domain